MFDFIKEHWSHPGEFVGFLAKTHISISFINQGKKSG